MTKRKQPPLTTGGRVGYRAKVMFPLLILFFCLKNLICTCSRGFHIVAVVGSSFVSYFLYFHSVKLLFEIPSLAHCVQVCLLLTSNGAKRRDNC